MMCLFHRSSRKETRPQATRKHHLGTRKSLKTITGTKTPEPITAPVPRRRARRTFIEVAQSSAPPCQNVASKPETLWDRAYDALRSSNDPDKSDLIANYERRVLQALMAKSSGEDKHHMPQQNNMLM